MEEQFGMAPTPDQMNKMDKVLRAKSTNVEKKKGASQRRHVRVTAGSAPTSMKTEVQQIIYGVHWQYQKRILDILKIVTDNEKWEVTRNIAMDIITEQVETTRILVGRRIADELGQESEDNENGYNGLSEE